MKGMSANPFKIMSSANSTTTASSLLAGYYDGSNIRTGLISPALSANTSTSVTPITPMTPLSTPRTPAQALLGRLPTKSGDGSGHHYQQRPPLSSSYGGSSHHVHFQEDHQQQQQQQLLALQLFSNFIDTAETTLEHIADRERSGNQVIGSGIVRICNDLADNIDEVAKELRREKDLRIEQFEQAMSMNDLILIEEGSAGDAVVDATSATALALSSTLANGGSSIADGGSSSFSSSHEEMINSMSTAHTLLLDLAAALRAITLDEAQELGEVALEVAKMFVWSLRMVHSNMIQMTMSSLEDERRDKSKDGRPRVTWSSSNGSGRQGLGPVVEILGEEEKKDEHGVHIGTPPKNMSPKYSPKLSPIPSSPSRLSPVRLSSTSSRDTQGRLRVLWPPILPAITEAGSHVVHSAKEHPLSAVAIGLTCGPAAVATALFVAPPVLIADWAIQSSYDALSGTPVIENVERGASNACQIARLGVLCSKLVVKQGMSVGKRQIKRRGGVGKICSDVVDGAVDMAMHPFETAGMAWEGLFWMGSAARDAIGFVKESVSGGRGDLRVDMH